MFTNIRSRFDRRAIAFIAILAIALAGTGISSLALLQDKVTATLNGSLTTIDFKADGAKSVTFNVPAGKIAGDLVPFPVHLTNAGTGYVRLTSALTGLSGTTVLTGSTYTKWWGIPLDQCVSGPTITDNYTSDPTPRVLSAGPLFDEFQIDGGGSKDVCLIVKLGDPGLGAGNFAASWDWNAIYP